MKILPICPYDFYIYILIVFNPEDPPHLPHIFIREIHTVVFILTALSFFGKAALTHSYRLYEFSS
jgi:hypothetical protein